MHKTSFNILFILFVIAAASFNYSCVNENSDPGLLAMSFNIRYNNPDDGINSWGNRRLLFDSIMQECKPDIAGLQEVLHDQLMDILQHHPDYAYSGVGRIDGKTMGEYAPILFFKERFKLMDEGYFWLSETPEIPGSKGWDAACERIVNWIKLQEKPKGAEFYLFNTHFDHIGETARINSAILIKDSMRKVNSQYPVIVTGDFNTLPGSEPYKTMLQYQTRFVDTKIVAKPDKTILKPTFTGFNKNVSDDRIIDFVFVTENIKVKNYQVVANLYGDLFVSDHAPVLVELQLK